MHAFPILGRNHLDRVPRATIEKSPVRPFTRAFLTANAKVGIDFDASEWRVILVRNPEHTRFDRTVFDARRRTGATGAAIRGDGKNPRFLLARGFAVTN